MADLPISLDPALAEQLVGVLDVEGKIPRALQSLGPVEDRDVLVLDGAAGLRVGQLEALGARVRHVDRLEDADSWPPESVDVVVGWWSAFRGVDANEQGRVDRLLRDGGRLLIVHDYGRDDVSRLRGDLPEYASWGRRNGPFLTAGFRIRVLHCWWTFASLEAAADFLTAAFGEAGRAVAEGMKRPRLSYNVAVYHRTRGDYPDGPPPTGGAG